MSDSEFIPPLPPVMEDNPPPLPPHQPAPPLPPPEDSTSDAAALAASTPSSSPAATRFAAGVKRSSSAAHESVGLGHDESALMPPPSKKPSKGATPRSNPVLRMHKLTPGEGTVTGMGMTIAPSGGNPFENQRDDEYEILDEVEDTTVDEWETTQEDVRENEDEDGEAEEGLFDDEDIDALLDKDLPEPAEKPYVEVTRTVMDVFDEDSLEVLPANWLRSTHESGIPLYLDRSQRVVTLSRPYYIGVASIRKHAIPREAIPCRFEKMRQKKEKRLQAQMKKSAEESVHEATSDGTPSLAGATQNGDASASELENLVDSTPVRSSKRSSAKRKCDGESVKGSDLNSITQADSAGKPTADSMVNNTDTQGSQHCNGGGVCPYMHHAAGAASSNNRGSPKITDNKHAANDTAENSDDDGSECGDKSCDVSAADDGYSGDISRNDELDECKLVDQFTPGDSKIRIEAVNTKSNDLRTEDIHKYCGKLWKFKDIKIRQFRTWKEKRKHLAKKRRVMRPMLPYNSQVFRCKRVDEAGTTNKKRDYVISVQGKGPIAILNEYLQHSVTTQPKFVDGPSESSAMPFLMTVRIGDMSYGSGCGASKKSAKIAAATEALKVLCPALYKAMAEANKDIKPDANEQQYKYFDDVKIEDARIDRLSKELHLPGPYTILTECLRRNSGLADNKLKTDMKLLPSNSRSIITMSVGKHKVELMCKNKRDGKQLVAQHMLKKLHPHVSTWGSMLRLYGTNNLPKPMEQATPQPAGAEAAAPEPNHAVLERLKLEMTKLQEKRNVVRSGFIGRIQLVPEDQSAPPPSLAHVDL